ncbi:MAG: hypothetical protein ACHQF0_15125 [Chitinophagales bacterium]
MKLIVKPKTKKEEKVIKTFLENHSIDYLKLEEDAAIYEKEPKAKSLSEKEKNTLKNPDGSVDLINKYKKEKLSKTNIKFINELQQSVEQVKLAKKGKITLQKAKDLFNEL